MTQNEYALIVAGGKGTRFGRDIPKQFAVLNGKPVLLHTVEAFYRYSDTISIVLVLPEEHISTWKNICNRYEFKKNVAIRAGGRTRFQSVKNGLEIIEDDGLVAIHDGVRPLITPDIISASFQLAKVHRAAVATVPLKESIRIVQADGQRAPDAFVQSTAADRSHYRMIQTPQTFNTSLIKEAYAMPEEASLTDDASVAEKAGFTVFLFDGSYSNIKITTPEDLVIAQALQLHSRTSVE